MSLPFLMRRTIFDMLNGLRQTLDVIPGKMPPQTYYVDETIEGIFTWDPAEQY